MGRAVTHLLVNSHSSASPGVGQIHFVTPSVCTAHCHSAETCGYHAAGGGAGCLPFNPLWVRRGWKPGAEQRLLLVRSEIPFRSAKASIRWCLDYCLGVEGSCKCLYDTKSD